MRPLEPAGTSDCCESSPPGRGRGSTETSGGGARWYWVQNIVRSCSARPVQRRGGGIRGACHTRAVCASSARYTRAVSAGQTRRRLCADLCCAVLCCAEAPERRVRESYAARQYCCVYWAYHVQGRASPSPTNFHPALCIECKTLTHYTCHGRLPTVMMPRLPGLRLMGKLSFGC